MFTEVPAARASACSVSISACTVSAWHKHKLTTPSVQYASPLCFQLAFLAAAVACLLRSSVACAVQDVDGEGAAAAE